ncbi:class I SAM-dependent methyltransferase [Salinicola avicenniae]|uniref:class I SAM-dependent methyltransferase n=1 Tax=Salinicola avicenniae TaxID=2916836 RepID=UPI0020739981|nr:MULTISPECIES: class I SAM-dependent methyltransferase [unclassified Salinicola]
MNNVKLLPAEALEQARLEAFEKVLDTRLRKLQTVVLSRQQEVDRQLYRQFEAFHWLTRRLSIRGRLPPLRGWPLSPDILLLLHEWIVERRPEVVVEFGSGASTLVIADALAQVGAGRLISIEHLEPYAQQTRVNLEREDLNGWVDLRVGELEPWVGEHLNERDDQKRLWYPVSLLQGVKDIDFVLVDGPPAPTCEFARYPALPAVADRLSPRATVWLDDAARGEEKRICQRWAERYHGAFASMPMEKGLGVFTFGNETVT